jgi:hypothetical protein
MGKERNIFVVESACLPLGKRGKRAQLKVKERKSRNRRC